MNDAATASLLFTAVGFIFIALGIPLFSRQSEAQQFGTASHVGKYPARPENTLLQQRTVPKQ
jgi:hypothetical protein